jgi:hypothetical protein
MGRAKNQESLSRLYSTALLHAAQSSVALSGLLADLRTFGAEEPHNDGYMSTAHGCWLLLGLRLQ